jgi:MinD superfamily P-loop ATPase
MKRHIANLDGKIVDVTEAKPVCSTDYCDNCGDCLALTQTTAVEFLRYPGGRSIEAAARYALKKKRHRIN